MFNKSCSKQLQRDSISELNIFKYTVNIIINKYIRQQLPLRHTNQKGSYLCYVHPVLFLFLRTYTVVVVNKIMRTAMHWQLIFISSSQNYANIISDQRFFFFAIFLTLFTLHHIKINKNKGISSVASHVNTQRRCTCKVGNFLVIPYYIFI